MLDKIFLGSLDILREIHQGCTLGINANRLDILCRFVHASRRLLGRIMDQSARVDLEKTAKSKLRKYGGPGEREKKGETSEVVVVEPWGRVVCMEISTRQDAALRA